MGKYFFAPMLLSVAGLLGGADMAMAQRGGHGGHGGHSGSHGGAHHGGYHGGTHHGGYYGGYYGGLRVGIYPGYGYSSGYSPYYYDGYPRYSYYTPSVDYVQPTFVNTSASVRVIVPDPQARVWFDGNPTSQTGNDRLFTSPQLSGTASYQIRAAWMRNGREVISEQTATVRPGQTSLVDFSKASSEAVQVPRSR